MKISNNALNFLLAQYRAIFKRAYIKGIASAVMLTVGLAAGQSAQAADPVYTAVPDNGNYYYQFTSGSGWSEASGTSVSGDGIIAGALGGNGFSGSSGSNLAPESALTIVTGGNLVIDGVGTSGSTISTVSGMAVAGGWAQASGGNITAQDNHVTIKGSGSVTATFSGNRGVVYGAWAKAENGIAFALNNTVTVDKGASGGTAAAQNGIYGAQAQGKTGAQAIGNIVTVLGQDAISVASGTQQTINFISGNGVVGGAAVALSGASGGTFEARDNTINLTNVSGAASGNAIVITGSYVDLNGSSGTRGVAGNTNVNITDSKITGTSGGAIVAMNIQNGSGSATINGNGAGLNITNSVLTNSFVDSGSSSNSLGLAIVGGRVDVEGSGSDAQVTNATVTLANTDITDMASGGSLTAIYGATIDNGGKSTTATGNKVTITEETDNATVVNGQVTGYQRTINSSVNAVAVNNSGTSGSFNLSSNAVDIGSSVNVNGSVYGVYLNSSDTSIQQLTINNNSLSIAGNVTGDVRAVHIANGTVSGTAQFLNNDVTLKNGGKVQSGSMVGGAGKDSVVSIENGATYIANNTSQDIASDVISIVGTVDVQAENTLDISGFYENGDVTAADTKFGDNLTSVASSAVIKNAGTINLYGKAVVDQGATLTATGADSVIKVDASKGITDSLLAEADKVVGGDQGTLAIFKDTLKSYLSADKVGSATTADSEASVQLTSGGTLEFRDTGNIDLATEFNFSNTSGTAGAIVVSGTANEGTIRGNELTISRKLAENAVATSESDTYATTYEGLTPTNLDTKGINIEANVLHLGSSTLESWQSEELTFGSATFRDQLTFAASSNGLSGTKAGTANQIINDGYHLVSEVIGDHYSVLQEQGTSLEDDAPLHYTAQDGVVEGDVIITATSSDSGSLVIRNGNYTADGSITIASGGNLTVGGDDKIDSNASDATNAPDATLVLGQALTFDLSKAGTGTVNVSGAESSSQRYDAVAAAETVGDDRHVVLDLRNGITLLGDADNLSGSAKINVTSGGEILLTGSNLTSLLAQNNANNDASGAYFSASSGGAFIVEGDVDATFGDFNGSGSTSGKHGITLKDGGYLVANSLTIDNSGAEGINEAKEETPELLASGSVDWGNGTVVVQDLEISNLQLTNGENKPTDANSYASYVTLAQGIAEIGSSLLSYNQTLKLGDTDSEGKIILATDDAAAEGVINVERIQVDSGSVAAANGVWDGANTDLILSGSGAALEVGYGAGGKSIDGASASLTLNTINMTGENTEVNVYGGGSLFAKSLSMAATSTMKVSAYGYAEFDSANFGALTTPAADESGAVVVYGHLKVNGDTNATIASGENQVDDPRNGVAFGQEGSLEIYKNGTLEFGLDAVNGAILNTSTTKTFNGSGSIDLDADYTKIANDGGTLKLDFAQGTVFDGEAIQTLKQALFTSGSFQEGVLKNGGILNIADGKFHGIEVSAQTGEGLSGYTATWESLKTFSDIYGNDVTNDQLIQTNVSGIQVDDNVQGHWASLSMASGVSTKAQVNLIGDTSLNYAAGNNGFFISDAAHQIALGAKVAGDRTLSLVDGGKIGTVSLTAANSQYEEETVLEITSTGNNPSAALTTIAEIKGEGVTNGVAVGTVADFSADADVTGDITGIDYVEAYNGAKLTAQNTAFVHELGTENATIAITNKAQFGNAYVMGGKISAKNAEMLSTLGDEIAVVNDGWFKVDETLTAHSGATIQVGVDASSMAESDLTLEDGTVAGGTGYFEVGTLELNGGNLIVDPEYTEATSVAAVGKFKEGKKSSYQYDNDKGILHGNLFVGQNAAFGLGATVKETQAAIAQFQVGNALDPEKYGSILYLNGQLDVSAGSHIALNSKESVDNKTTTAFLEATNAYNVSSETTEAGSSAVDRIAALGLGANTAIIMTNQAFEDADGEKTGTAIYFDRTNAAVKAGGGEIILAGDFDLSDNLNIFQDKDAEGQQGVDIKDGKILVKTLNGFLYTTLEGDNQGYNVKLDVNKPEAYGIMSEASDPVVETLIAYGVSVTGGATTPEVPETPVEPDTPSTPEGEGNTGTGNGSIVDVVGGNTETPAPEQQVAMTEIQPQANAEEAPAQTAAKSSFLERVIVNTHGAPAEQAARLGVYGGAAQVGLAAAGSNSDVLESRFGIGANAQSLNLASNGMGGTLWVAPIYKSSDSDDFGAQGLNYSVDFDLYGVALGGDYKVTNEVTVGAMFNVGSGSLDGQGNAAAAGTSNDFDYFGFALYGAYQAGALTVTGDLSYTQVDNDLEGSNEVGKLTASSDTSAWSLGVTGQYKFSFAAVDVTPHAGLRFTSLDLDDYSLEAAGYGNVANYDGDTLSVFSIPVGVTFAKTIEGESWNVTPALDLHVTGQFGDDEAEGTVAWTGTNLSTNVSSEIFDSFTYGATVGVQAESNSFSFGVGLGYTGSSNADEFSAQANARFTF